MMMLAILPKPSILSGIAAQRSEIANTAYFFVSAPPDSPHGTARVSDRLSTCYLEFLGMNILFIGDIFASAGRRIVADHLQDMIQTNHVDLAIANAENAAGGFGITPSIAEELFGMGLDVLTSGNHVWDKRDLYDYLTRQPRLLRPANYAGVPGQGVISLKARNGVECAVLNLQGRTYMPNTDCPFRKADQILSELHADIKVKFVDFHAEVTSEKMAMGWYLDGRVSALVGTHTHIPTADTRILPGGTAYQTDCGMTGPYQSVIGVETDIVIQRFLTALPVRMEAAKGKPELHAVLVDVDEATGKARAARRLALEGD
jgi:metallophosphoesterase (TIGR00282 family)